MEEARLQLFNCPVQKDVALHRSPSSSWSHGVPAALPALVASQSRLHAMLLPRMARSSILALQCIELLAIDLIDLRQQLATGSASARCPRI